MKIIVGILIVASCINTELIFNFEKDSELGNWSTVDDVVMGGRSNGSLSVTDDGHGLFSGTISLDNNGGFSSLRYTFNSILVQKDNLIKIRLKGDGKQYQFRVKNKVSDYKSYTTRFETTEDWQHIEIRLGDLFPTFRGRKLSRPDFDHDSIEEIRFLIGNKRPESFQLLIDKIELVKE